MSRTWLNQLIETEKPQVNSEFEANIRYYKHSIWHGEDNEEIKNVQMLTSVLKQTKHTFLWILSLSFTSVEACAADEFWNICSLDAVFDSSRPLFTFLNFYLWTAG